MLIGFNRRGTALSLILFLGFSLTSAFAQDQTYPKVDLFVGYSWLHPGGSIQNLQINDISKGFAATSTFNLNRYFGLSVDGSAHFSDQTDAGNIMFGPTFRLRSNQFSPFAHVMVGWDRMAVTGFDSSNGFGLRAGGGFDIPFTQHVAWRLVEVDFVKSQHDFAPIEGVDFNGAEVRTGLVFNFGFGPPPPPLAAGCSAQPTQVMAGEPVTVTATASNIRKNHTVQYQFRSTGGQVSPNNNAATVNTTGLAPGNYSVTATVTDAKLKQNGTANCSASFVIQEPPRHPPTISCNASQATVRAGEPATITCTGQSPDNRPLTYDWRSSGGRLTPQQNQATLDTAGASAGPITVTTTVSDDRGLTANTTSTVNVEVPPPPPQASKLNEIQFNDRRRPSRVDNQAKAILDDVALRLQREPDSRAVIVGNSESNERNAQRVAQERAVNTKAYLTQQKGIDPARVEVRTGQAGTRTAEVWIVPQGATFDQAGATTFDENSLRPQGRRAPRR